MGSNLSCIAASLSQQQRRIWWWCDANDGLLRSIPMECLTARVKQNEAGCANEEKHFLLRLQADDCLGKLNVENEGAEDDGVVGVDLNGTAIEVCLQLVTTNGALICVHKLQFVFLSMVPV